MSYQLLFRGCYIVGGTVGIAEIPDSSRGRPVFIFHRGLVTGYFIDALTSTACHLSYGML